MFDKNTFSYFLLAAVVQAKYIVPGGRWTDTNGNLVNAHAGGVTVGKDGKFYLFGEYKIQGQTEGGGVSVYSSDDLATWTSHGLALGKSSRFQDCCSREIVLMTYRADRGTPVYCP